MGAIPRRRPCSSCPYRRNVPSGVWEAEEYAKLPAYDAPTGEQPLAPFMCHHSDGHVCAGWLGFGDPSELLAVRLGMMTGVLDPSCADYSTTVPLFESGAAAAEHGIRDVEHPSAEAIAAAAKIVRVRDRG